MSLRILLLVIVSFGCFNSFSQLSIPHIKLASDAFGASSTWITHSYQGSDSTWLADVNGDGMADLIRINHNSGDPIKVSLSQGNSFGTESDWTNSSFVADYGNYFADVNGDGFADAIAVNSVGVMVRLSNGYSQFSPATAWTEIGYFGSSGNYFADVNGDARADAIVINNDAVTVRLADTSLRFLPNANWTNPSFKPLFKTMYPLTSFIGEWGNYFADVNGDGLADLISSTNSGIKVFLSFSTGFMPSMYNWTDISYLGSKGAYFDDVNGDGMADAIVVNNDFITVRISNGSQFLPNESWTNAPFYGTNQTYIADLNGDGKADVVAKNSSNMLARLSLADNFYVNPGIKAANFAMIISSDPQWAWTPIQDKTMYNPNLDIDSFATVLNQNQVSSMNRLIDSLRYIQGTIINGDLTAFGHSNEFSKYESFYDNLHSTIYPGLGNHDYANNVNDCVFNNCATRMADYMSQFLQSSLSKIPQTFTNSLSSPDINITYHTYPIGITTSSTIGSMAYSWDLHRIHFVQLQNYPIYNVSWISPHAGYNSSYYISQSLDWLEKDLAKAYNQHQKIILNFHQSNYDIKNPNQWCNNYSVNDCAALKLRFKNMLKKYNVSAVFVGHIHTMWGKYEAPKAPPEIFGSVPVFYCGSTSQSKYLLVEFIKNRMRVRVVNSITGSPQINQNPLIGQLKKGSDTNTSLKTPFGYANIPQ